MISTNYVISITVSIISYRCAKCILGGAVIKYPSGEAVINVGYIKCTSKVYHYQVLTLTVTIWSKRFGQGVFLVIKDAYSE